jgi:hypothetical protein
MEKVKEVIHKVTHPKEETHTTGTHTAGTHTSGTHTTGTGATGHNAGVAGTHGTAGPHDSNLANKADPRVDSDMDGSRNYGAAQHGPGAHHNTGTTLGSGSNTAGPHSSNLANKADPRVDSDMDGSRNAGAANYGPGATSGSGLTGSHQSTGTTGSGYGSTTAGPHDSNLLNKADPRVDSDRDGSRNMGASNYGPGATSGGLTGSHQTTGAGYGSTTSSNTAGPHSSNLANKLDPRVDSDMDGSRNMGAAQHGPGAHNAGNSHTGTTHNTGAGYDNTGAGYDNTGSGLTGNTGSGLTGSTHNNGAGYGNTGSGLTGNTGSGLTGSTHNNGAGYGNTGSGLTGTAAHGGHHGHHGNLDGPAPNTAGPHKSDMLNKVDPRIDSDRDGSKTVGGNPQY